MAIDNGGASAVREAATMLRWAETGYNHKYGSVPLDTRIELARAWIELAKVEESTPMSVEV